MHFFSPVPAMKLVEIINAYDTSEDTIETGKAVAKGFGKEFVTVTDVAHVHCQPGDVPHDE